MDNINKNEKFRVLSTIAITISFILNFGLFISVKSRLLCKMLYNVFTISTYQN